DERIVVNHDLRAVDHRMVDYEIPIMSLGLALDVGLEDIPGITGYLRPNEEALDKFRSRLGAIRGFKVGVAWTGKPTLGKHVMRSVDPSLFGILD
ncbi:MAG: hypothetical protein N2Z74_05080, partial [Syntrophales bacterium]|nr:hypothetical protein [Syntrophales bacterium]